MSAKISQIVAFMAAANNIVATAANLTADNSHTGPESPNQP